MAVNEGGLYLRNHKHAFAGAKHLVSMALEYDCDLGARGYYFPRILSLESSPLSRPRLLEHQVIKGCIDQRTCVDVINGIQSNDPSNYSKSIT